MKKIFLALGFFSLPLKAAAPEGLFWHAESGTLAFRAVQGSGEFVATYSGKSKKVEEGPSLERIQGIQWTPAGLVYKAEGKKKNSLYINHRSVATHDSIGEVFTDAGSKKIAFRYSENGQDFLQYGDKSFGPFRAIFEVQLRRGGGDGIAFVGVKLKDFVPAPGAPWGNLNVCVFLDGNESSCADRIPTLKMGDSWGSYRFEKCMKDKCQSSTAGEYHPRPEIVKAAESPAFILHEEEHGVSLSLGGEKIASYEAIATLGAPEKYRVKGGAADFSIRQIEQPEGKLEVFKNNFAGGFFYVRLNGRDLLKLETFMEDSPRVEAFMSPSLYGPAFVLISEYQGDGCPVMYRAIRIDGGQAKVSPRFGNCNSLEVMALKAGTKKTFLHTEFAPRKAKQKRVSFDF